MGVKTNVLKKGVRIQLRNGWYATIADNAKGNIRMADVEGLYREIGSVYSHDIMRALLTDGSQSQPITAWIEVEHTPEQIKLRKQVTALGM